MKPWIAHTFILNKKNGTIMAVYRNQDELGHLHPMPGSAAVGCFMREKEHCDITVYQVV
jgi:hypothetical protein